MSKIFGVNKGTFYRTCRMLHAYLSAAAFLLLMFFAVSGFLLNHPKWLGAGRATGAPVILELDEAALARALGEASPELALAGMIKGLTPVQGKLKDARINEDEIVLRFAGVKGNTDVFLDIEMAEAEIELSRANVTSMVHDLHRGKDAGPVWKLLIDATAVLIIAMSLMGLILFLSLRFRLATSVKLMAGTLGVFIALFVLLVP